MNSAISDFLPPPLVTVTNLSCHSRFCSFCLLFGDPPLPPTALRTSYMEAPLVGGERNSTEIRHRGFFSAGRGAAVVQDEKDFIRS